MEELQVRGIWNEIKGEVKKKWAALRDDDLQYAEGREDELVGRIQERTGLAREEIREELNRYAKEYRSRK